jgi:nitrite reductase (NADH) small subunit
MSDMIDIGALADIPLRGARKIRTERGCVAVFRAADDAVFALDDRCPHRGGPLSDGIVHGRSVTCPLHNWVISLETGAAQGADEGRVATIPCRVEGGRVLVDAAALGLAAADLRGAA